MLDRRAVAGQGRSVLGYRLQSHQAQEELRAVHPRSEEEEEEEGMGQPALPAPTQWATGQPTTIPAVREASRVLPIIPHVC